MGKRREPPLHRNTATPRLSLYRVGERFGGAPVEEAKTTHSARAFIWLAVLGALSLLAVAALLLGLNVRGWRDRLIAGPTRPQSLALAVLPLANLSGDPEQEYFADGMTEALITELGKINAPRVISRQSIMQYKGSKKRLSEIARELNVDAVLEGTVGRSGDRVRVIVRLDQVSPEGQLWSNQYNRDIRDLLRLQDEIARAVTDEIQVKLKPQERTRLASSRPVNPEAQDDYFRALHSRNRWEAGSFPYGEQDLQTAISYFRQAIEKDSNYGLAYAGMADTYSTRSCNSALLCCLTNWGWSSGQGRKEIDSNGAKCARAFF